MTWDTPIMADPGVQLFALSIQATGEVRDADGVLISSEPVEATAILTEDEARQLIERQAP